MPNSLSIPFTIFDYLGWTFLLLSFDLSISFAIFVQLGCVFWLNTSFDNVKNPSQSTLKGRRDGFFIVLLVKNTS